MCAYVLNDSDDDRINIISLELLPRKQNAVPKQDVAMLVIVMPVLRLRVWCFAQF